MNEKFDVTKQDWRLSFIIGLSVDYWRDVQYFMRFEKPKIERGKEKKKYKEHMNNLIYNRDKSNYAKHLIAID